MDSNTAAVWSLVVVNGVALVTVVIRGIFSAEYDRRHRQYELDDRKAIALKVEQTAITLAQKVELESREMKQAIAHNTALTQEGVDAASDAYHEANTVNLKLEKLGLTQQQLEKQISEHGS